MKVYLYYLKSDSGHNLYAYTIDKDIKKEFEGFRSMKKFHKRTEEMDEYEFRCFSNKYSNQRLFDIPLFDGVTDCVIKGTMDEEIAISEFSEELDTNFEIVTRELLSVDWKDKYLKIIKKATDVIKVKDSSNGTKDFELKVNTFSVFFELFKYTL